jgi:hypothetical protein
MRVIIAVPGNFGVEPNQLLRFAAAQKKYLPPPCRRRTAKNAKARPAPIMGRGTRLATPPNDQAADFTSILT